MPRMNALSTRIPDLQPDCGRLGRRHTAWGRRASRPRLELLEERMLLSIIVENSSDNGPGSLRAAIATANANPGDTIEFDMTPGHVTSPITLTSGVLDIRANVDIEGPGAAILTISGNNSSAIFDVSSGVNASISGLTIAHGFNNISGGGGIFNEGTLAVANDVFVSNSASGAGGAICNNTGGNLSGPAVPSATTAQPTEAGSMSRRAW